MNYLTNYVKVVHINTHFYISGKPEKYLSNNSHSWIYGNNFSPITILKKS
jgi:hypothetical protein